MPERPGRRSRASWSDEAESVGRLEGLGVCNRRRSTRTRLFSHADPTEPVRACIRDEKPGGRSWTSVDIRRELLTTAEVAAALGVHERTLRRYLSSGLLEYRRLPGGHYRVPASALTDFWQANDPNLRGGYAGRRADLTQTSQASGRRRRQRPSSSSKHPRLGTQTTGDYDLSIGKLRALRKRLS